MEDNQPSSMTDRDRKMRFSFETFGDASKRREKRLFGGLAKRNILLGEAKTTQSSQTLEKPLADDSLVDSRDRAQLRQGLLRNLISENTQAARRAQEVDQGVAEQDVADKKQKDSETPDGQVESTSSEPPDKEVIAQRSNNRNIVAAATLNTDPNLAKMNEYYYRRKKTGKVLLSGLVGLAVSKQRTKIRRNAPDGSGARVEHRSNDVFGGAGNRETKAQSVDVRTMSMPELLQLAEHIDTGSGSLKDMYLQGRIDTVNLRKVVSESVAGRDFSALLKRSLQAEEMKHELRSEIKTANTQAPRSDPVISGAAKQPISNTSLESESRRNDTPEDVQQVEPVKNSKQPQSSSAAREPAPIVEPPIVANPELQRENQVTESVIIDQRTIDSSPTVEYIRISAFLAVVIGIIVGGAMAAILLLFVF